MPVQEVVQTDLATFVEFILRDEHDRVTVQVRHVDNLDYKREGRTRPTGAVGFSYFEAEFVNTDDGRKPAPGATRFPVNGAVYRIDKNGNAVRMR